MSFSRKYLEYLQAKECFMSKSRLKLRSILLLFLGLFLFSSGQQHLYSQDSKKNKVRIKAYYVKVMNKEIYFDVSASSKIGKDNVDVSNIELTVYNEYDDEKVELGSTTTNMKGKSRFVVKDPNAIKADSTDTYNILISFKGNDAFKRASKRISFKDAEIEAKIITKDSLYYITAILKDTSTDSLITETSLKVQVQRLFQPLLIGEEFNLTDENGTIIVPIEEGIPGVDGKLNIEVVLSDSDVYGTVKDIVIAPVGIPIVDESTFDQRKMWSSRDKTPLFLLIFPNMLIFGMWSLILYLMFNLFKISKSKN
jgi:hypothetical protein